MCLLEKSWLLLPLIRFTIIYMIHRSENQPLSLFLFDSAQMEKVTGGNVFEL